MARITVEDCLDKVDNRFELVMVASKRSRQLQIEGKEPHVEVDNDKPTVIALREIAEGLVDAEILKEKPKVEMEDMEGLLAESEDGEASDEAKADASDSEAADAEASSEQAESDEQEEAQAEPADDDK